MTFLPLRSALTILAALSLFSAFAPGQIPAFPGAEGFGGYATGGRGGDVYTVTNLNAAGSGSFADAISTVPGAGRTIVFAVSGHIHLPSGKELRLTGSKVTIAGQTAPGDGIGLKDGTFRISGDDVVVRHLRFRFRSQASGGDCVNLDSGSTNSIVDHVSIQFSKDENISSFNSPPENVTMQWALNGWGLESHSCGGLWDQNHATCHHSLWAHNHTRNPKARPNGVLDWINNVTFDWDIGFIMGDSETPAAWKANVRNSYFLCPPGNIRGKALEKANLDRNGVPNFSLYLNNCRHDSDGNGILDGTDKGYAIASGNYTTLAAPVATTGAVPVTIDDPVVGFKKIVSSAGALRLDIDAAKPLRDDVDTIMVNNLVTQKRMHVSNESQTGASNGGIGMLDSTAAPTDTDKDGMPDYYEAALAWNTAVDDHNTTLASSGGVISGTTFFSAGTVAGYTRLEEYLHFLAIPHGTLAKNVVGTPTSVAIDLRKFTSGFSQAPAFAVSNVIGGAVVLSGTGNAIATFTPTLNHTGRARFEFTVTDGAGHSWTQTCGLVITNTGLPRDLIWKGDGTANLWDYASANWLRNGAATKFSTGDTVTFDDTGSLLPAVNTQGTQATPGAMIVDASGAYTFAGSGILGTGELIKRGTGTLTFSNAPVSFPTTRIEGGTVALGAGSTIAGGTVTMLDGSTFANVQAAGTQPGVPMPFDVPAGQTATIKTGNRISMTGAVTGAGTINYLVETTVNRADLKGVMGAFTGDIRFSNSGGVRLFYVGGSFGGFDGANLEVGGSVSLQPQTNSGGNTLAIGGLSSTSANAKLEGGTAGAVAYVVGANGNNTSFAGAISGNASFTKTGAGQLILSGTNTYTGATSVNAGVLNISGSLGNTSVTIANGAQLAGSGTIGGTVSGNTGAIISPGTVPFTGAVMNAGSGLSLNGATLRFDLSGSPGGLNDQLVLNGGTMTLTGTQTFQFLLLNGSLSAGNYVLINGAATSTASGVSLVHNLPSGARQTFTVKRDSTATPNPKVWLEVQGDPATLTWTGTANSNWDTATANNWTGATPNTFGSNDAVIFDDSSSVNVVQLPVPVLPRSMLVNNSTEAFSISGGINGGSLTKSGSNTLTLAGANTYGGGTVLNAGTIVLADDAGNAGGLGSGAVTLNAGVLSMHDDSSTFNAFNAALAVPAGATARLNADSRVDLYGTLSGGGTLNFYVPFVRTTLFADWSAFTGIINVISDGDGGDLRMGTNYSFPGFPRAAIALTANTSCYYSGILNGGAGTTIEIGELSGPGNSHLRGGATGGRNFTYRIGGRNTDAAFSGDFAEQNTGTTTALVKTGTGMWTLAGPCTHRGATTVEAGTLRITGSLTNDSPLTVQSGGTLSLQGAVLNVDSVNVASGGALTGSGSIEGDFNNDGTVTVGSGILNIVGDIVNSGTMRITNGAQLQATGALVNNGILDLLTSPSALPAGIENHGIVIENSQRRILSASKAGANFTVTTQSYPGHNYQLQRASSLGSAWSNAGVAEAGTGSLLVLTDTGGAVGTEGFYRVMVSP